MQSFLGSTISESLSVGAGGGFGFWIWFLDLVFGFGFWSWFLELVRGRARLQPCRQKPEDDLGFKPLRFGSLRDVWRSEFDQLKGVG